MTKCYIFYLHQTISNWHTTNLANQKIWGGGTGISKCCDVKKFFKLLAN